jgi:hypothetical protein
MTTSGGCRGLHEFLSGTRGVQMPVRNKQRPVRDEQLGHALARPAGLPQRIGSLHHPGSAALGGPRPSCCWVLERERWTVVGALANLGPVVDRPDASAGIRRGVSGVPAALPSRLAGGHLSGAALSVATVGCAVAKGVVVLRHERTKGAAAVFARSAGEATACR